MRDEPAHGIDPVRRSGSDAVTWPVRAAAAWTWRLLLFGLAIYILARIFVRIELVAFSFVLSLFLVAILHPLERRINALIPKPRSVSAVLSLLVGLVVLAAIGYFVVAQISTHAEQLNNQITTVVHNADNWLHNGPLKLKSSDLDRLTNNITKTLKQHQGQLISGAISTLRTVVEGLTGALLILLTTFFLLRDGASVWAWTVRLFPRATQQRVDHAGQVGWHTFGGYMRGQLIIALFHGVTITIVLVIMRVPLAAALGVLIFLGSFIPLVGLIVTGAFAVAMALLEHGLTSAIVVTIAIIVLVQVEGHLLQPIVMSRSVDVHPLAIALSVIAGTTLAGIVGALLAVPLVAFVNSTVRALREPPPATTEVDVGSLAADDTEPDPDRAATENASEDRTRDEPEDGGSPAPDDHPS